MRQVKEESAESKQRTSSIQVEPPTHSSWPKSNIIIRSEALLQVDSCSYVPSFERTPLSRSVPGLTLNLPTYLTAHPIYSLHPRESLLFDPCIQAQENLWRNRTVTIRNNCGENPLTDNNTP